MFLHFNKWFNRRKMRLILYRAIHTSIIRFVYCLCVHLAGLDVCFRIIMRYEDSQCASEWLNTFLSRSPSIYCYLTIVVCTIESLTTRAPERWWWWWWRSTYVFTLRKRNERSKPKRSVLCSSFARQKNTHIPIAAAAPTAAAATTATQIENEWMNERMPSGGNVYKT